MERYRLTSGYGLPAATVIAYSLVELFNEMTEKAGIGNQLNAVALTFAVVFVSVYLCQALVYRHLDNKRDVARFSFSMLLLTLGILTAFTVHIRTIYIVRSTAATESAIDLYS